MAQTEETPRFIIQEDRRTEMTEVSGDTLREFIRLVPPARALKGELDRIIGTETWDGIGDVVVRNYQSLNARVLQLTNDPYVASLSPSDSVEEATDQQKVNTILLSTSQLIAYLEASTGMVTSPAGNTGQIQTAREIYNGAKYRHQIENISTTTEEATKIAAMFSGHEKESAEEEPGEEVG